MDINNNGRFIFSNTVKIRYIFLSLLSLLFSCATVPVETFAREFDTSGMEIREQVYLDMTERKLFKGRLSLGYPEIRRESFSVDIYQAVNFKKISLRLLQWPSEQEFYYEYGKQKFVCIEENDEFHISLIYDKSRDSVELVKEISFVNEGNFSLTAPEQGDNPNRLPLPLFHGEGEILDFTVFGTRERAGLRNWPRRLFPNQFSPGEVDDVSKALCDKEQLFQFVGSDGSVYASLEENILTIYSSLEVNMVDEIITTAKVLKAYIKLIEDSEEFRRKLGRAIREDLPNDDYPTFPFRYEEDWNPGHTIFLN